MRGSIFDVDTGPPAVSAANLTADRCLKESGLARFEPRASDSRSFSAQTTLQRRFLLEGGPADRIRVFHCKARFISRMKSSGCHGRACQVIQLSWPDISSGKPLCARSGETGLAVVLSRRRLTHRVIRAVMPIVAERLETNRYSWAGDLPMCTSSMGRHTCST